MKWSFSHTEHTAGSRDDVWRLWSDVASWPTWDAGVETVALDGPFAAGTTGRLKPAGSKPVGIRLLEARPGEGFVDETRLPLATMRFEHSLADDGDGTLITHRVTISGPLTPLWKRVVGRDFVRELPGTVRSLAEHAA